jgi:hypothetical protein
MSFTRVVVPCKNGRLSLLASDLWLLVVKYLNPYESAPLMRVLLIREFGEQTSRLIVGRWCRSLVMEQRSVDGTLRRLLCQTLTSVDGLPAEEYANGDKHWWVNGKRGRAGGLPATMCANGNKHWYVDDKPGRAGGLPASEYADGDKFWYVDGKLGRADGLPAVERARVNGDKFWYVDGKLGRADGLPAVERANGGKFTSTSMEIHYGGQVLDLSNPEIYFNFQTEIWCEDKSRPEATNATSGDKRTPPPPTEAKDPVSCVWLLLFKLY